MVIFYLEVKTSNMKNVIKILVERDGISIDEATELILETRNMILKADQYDADQIIMDNLGLEPDYIFDILG